MKIKGMDRNMQCRGFQFEVGKEYKKDNNGRPLELCSDTVFHYCNSLRDVNCFYDVAASDNRFFEIEVLGEEVTDGTKRGSDHIKILREITGEELNNLKGLINGNAGLFNSGNRNSGDRNSGDWNSGDGNSGDWNSGDWNSGDWNSGNLNSGNWNSGNLNSGNWNSGNWNSGDWNSGNWNSGYGNSGNWNSGYGNKCNGSNGVFCTEEDMNIRIFNKPSGMSLRDFYRSKIYDALCSAPFILNEWIEYTDEEKAEDEEKALIGGYLKTYTMKEAWTNWWEEMTYENKEIIKSIPNFDAKIFKEITGIEVK